MQEVLPQQGLLADTDLAEKVLAYIPDEGVRQKLREKWAAREGALLGPGEELNALRWKNLVDEMNELRERAVRPRTPVPNC